MKYIVIGDIHGKIDHVRYLLKFFPEHHKIFVGDYVDSFTHGRKKQKRVLTELVYAVQTRDDVTCLLGNHEMSYLKTGMQCSGYSSGFHRSMTMKYPNLLQLFKKYMYLPGIALITHAGASGDLFSSAEDVIQEVENGGERLYRIGRSRGGYSLKGGIFWCDFWQEFSPIRGLTQIVGHTARRLTEDTPGIVQLQDCWNIDCLDRVFEVMEIDTEREDPMRIIKLDKELQEFLSDSKV